MDIEYSRLLEQMVYEKSIDLIDAKIIFHSSSLELVDFAVDEISSLLPVANGDILREFSCIIDIRAAASIRNIDLPRYSDPGGKDITSPELGEAKLFTTGNQMVIAVRDLAILYHSGTGRFIIAIENDSLREADGRKLNVHGVFNLLLSEVLIHCGKLLVHAGAVGSQNKCHIWTGESGAGKTTRILNLVGKGYAFFGDDQVIVGRNRAGKWCAWPFWRPLKVKPDSLSRMSHLPFMEDGREVNTEEKIIFNDMPERLQMDKPFATELIDITCLIPGNGGILQDLNQEEAFDYVAPAFMHSSNPQAMTSALEIVLDLLETVPVRKVSWDRLDDYDQRHRGQ